ncbi:unnamed protein product [Adineta ricciae]|uniref:RanBP2-type domain-containing protein n=1 Tax=Adineta ricciae TaxID=249248 RepID=A0A814QMN2_ADIRI|nr:unnamed protein product [Adineta ricciae]
MLKFQDNSTCYCRGKGILKFDSLHSATTHILRMGDWDCPRCWKLNFASRSVCLKCEQTKYSSYTQAAMSITILHSSRTLRDSQMSQNLFMVENTKYR